MNTPDPKYMFEGISLKNIRNRNETRVIKALSSVLTDFPSFTPDSLDIEDVYALTLNSIPPRYVQNGSVVLREEVSQDDLEDAIRLAIKTVAGNPNH